MKRLLLSIAIVTANSLWAQCPMVLHLPFNGNANDVSPTGNNGTVSGPSLVNDRFGNPLSAYSFDGLNDYIELAFPMPDMTTLSFSAWVKYTGTSRGMVFFEGSNTAANDFYLEYNGGVDIGITANKSGATLGTYAITGMDSLDQWHHVVWVMTPAQSTVYIDGVLEQTITASASAVGFHSLHAMVGAFWDGDPGYSIFFQGMIDDIRIYNCALSASGVGSVFTAIEEFSLTPVDIQPYPNPTNGNTTLEFTNLKQEDHTLKLYNAQGKLIRTISNITTEKFTFETGDLASGLYFFQLNNEEQVRFKGKLAIE